MTDYNKLKVADLRNILKERGIPSTGLSRKQQIVDALESHDATQAQDATETEGDVAESNASAAVASGSGEVEEQPAEDLEAVVAESAAENAQEDPDYARTDNGGANGDAQGTVVEDIPMAEAVENGDSQDPLEPLADPTALPVEVQLDTILADSKAMDPETQQLQTGPETPRQVSASPDGQSSETRKRKRRSPSPTLHESSVNKKLKAAEDEPIKLPEDEVDRAPVAPNVSSGAGDHKKILPYGTSDDVMEVIAEPAASEPTSYPIEEPRPPQNSYEHDVGQEKEDNPTMPLSPTDNDSSGPPSTHPTTRSLYIRELMRPLQAQQLREHIVTLAARPGEDLDESVVTNLHLDNIRTHAFVSFASTSAASRVRTALHGRVWPDESIRKQLWVDYVPDEQVQEWIDRELEAGNDKRNVRRWEVEYSTLNNGTITASLQEITAPTGPRRRSSFSNPLPAAAPGQGVMNAPTGPRGHRPSAPSSHPPPTEHRPIRTPTPGNSNSNATASSFNILDERFSSTTTKPKIYYQPVSASLAEKRLDAMDSATSRTWDNGRAMKRATGVEQQAKRYTFEDGDRLVDGGFDASFGYRGPGSGGFSGRGGGGGYRGGRGGGRK